MARISVPEADAVIDEAFPVLDQGFVRLVDYIGGDARVVQAARVSYGAGTKTVREDKGLINYLMRNAHTSPFEQVSVVYHIKLPLFVFAQMVRHRTAKLNSMSARYSEMADEFYLPKADQIRGQSQANKQVADGRLPSVCADNAADLIECTATNTYGFYRAMLDDGVGREQARMVLPQNLYTQIYWKCDLHNLFHFLRLRLDWHAQQEIRAYAEVIADLARKVAPMCYEAFEEHILNAQRFGATEVEALKLLLASQPHGLEGRAAQEFEAKLGLTP